MQCPVSTGGSVRRSPSCCSVRSCSGGCPADSAWCAMTTRTRRIAAAQWQLTALVVVALASVSWYVSTHVHDWLMLGYWFAGAAVIAACLVSFCVGRRWLDRPVAPGRVLCIVPAYNESQDGLTGTVQALLRQTVPVDIVVIDDGS